ncbi:MAG TPA: amidase [Methylomirabilota bacterium]|jgi:aspartyl-tRNA(Asn)/glutamyl-tRNA(Gln) amidotransferase subunit A
MTRHPELTIDELRARIAATRLPIPEERLEMVRKLLANALAPIGAADWRAANTLEPAVTFDAGTPGGANPSPSISRGSATGAGAAASAEAGDLAFLGIRELGRRFRRHELSPLELTRALLERISKLDGTLRSYVTVTADRALADAKAAESALAQGDSRPLIGIPVAYKDLYATRGILTTAGSAVLADWTPSADSTCVARLQAAGCVMLGKLITHEFAFGIQFPGHRFPAARNPWNLDHIPGGSSSGSGAALAAGLAVGALGSDTGGSIRGPAAFSGIVGLKPTYGRCSRAGVVTLSWSLDHTGPMARSVEDCAYLLGALAGYDAADPASSHAPVGDYLSELGQGIRGLRIGVPRAYFLDEVQPEVSAAFERALGTLRELGASVEDVEIPSIRSAPAFMAIMLSEAFAYHERDLRERPQLYGEVLREKLMAGGLVSATEYVQAQRLRARLQAEVRDVLGRVEILATPTTLSPAPAFKAVFDPDFPFAKSNMAPFNMTGLPALAVPCGFSASGLPLSLQLAGRPFDEATVLRAGHAYEQATEWHRRRAPAA